MGSFLGSDLAAVMVANDGEVIVKAVPLKRLPTVPSENVLTARTTERTRLGVVDRWRIYVVADHRTMPDLMLLLHEHRRLLDHHFFRPQSMEDDEFWAPIPGIVVAYMDLFVSSEKKWVYIEAMAVRPAWRKNSLLVKMLDWAQLKWPDYWLWSNSFTEAGAATFSKWRVSREMPPLIIAPGWIAMVEKVDAKQAQWAHQQGLLKPAHVAYFKRKGWL